MVLLLLLLLIQRSHQRPSTWPTCVVAATITVSAHQHVVTLLSDGQGHALLTAHLLLQVRLRRTHFRLPPGTLIRMILFIANWKLTWFLHLYRLHYINCIFVRRCWAPVEWRHSKLSWWWWWCLARFFSQILGHDGYKWDDRWPYLSSLDGSTMLCLLTTRG